MKIIIVTGMSGAGKSTALNVLEDEGYYCVDNMPISLMPKFAELADGHNQDKGYNNIALGIDIRSGHSLAAVSYTHLRAHETKPASYKRVQGGA